MSGFIYFHFAVTIILAIGLVLTALRAWRRSEDDPRLSRGLQLLQAKIAVLDDLSERTEVQVKQLSGLLDQKSRELQDKVVLAERHVQQVRAAIKESLEVAKIFQDKIPHQEIIERQNTMKYVQAARLAHQGVSAADIARQLELPLSEAEFIAKVNRDRLLISDEQLPIWARVQNQELDFFESVDQERSMPMDSAAQQLNEIREQLEAESCAEEQTFESEQLAELRRRQATMSSLHAGQKEMQELISTQSIRGDGAKTKMAAPKAAISNIQKVEFPRITSPIRE